MSKMNVMVSEYIDIKLLVVEPPYPPFTKPPPRMA